MAKPSLSAKPARSLARTGTGEWHDALRLLAIDGVLEGAARTGVEGRIVRNSARSPRQWRATHARIPLAQPPRLCPGAAAGRRQPSHAEPGDPGVARRNASRARAASRRSYQAGAGAG